MKKIKEYKFNFFFHYRLFYNIYFLFYILEFVSFIKICKALPDLKFTKSITLLNGNIFIIHQNGISIYNSSLNGLIENITYFSEDLLINNHSQLDKVTISRFNETNYGYIISIINNIIYIFDYKGKMLKNDTTQIDKIKNGEYFTLIPIRKNKEELIYMIGFSENKKIINILFYIYDIYTINNTLFKDLKLTEDILKNRFNIISGNFDIKENFYTCSLIFLDNLFLLFFKNVIELRSQ